MIAENYAAGQRSFYRLTFSKQARESRDEEAPDHTKPMLASDPWSGAGVIVQFSLLDEGQFNQPPIFLFPLN